MSHADCCNENLSGYLDGELSNEEAGNIESHLHTCAHCKETLRKMQSLSNAVRQVPRPAAGPLLAARILNRIQTSEIYNETPFNRLFQSWGLLSLFVLGAIAILFGPVLLEIMRITIKHMAIVMSLVIKLSWQLPLNSTNLTLGLILIVGAIAAFYGFGRIYSAMTREGYTS